MTEPIDLYYVADFPTPLHAEKVALRIAAVWETDPGERTTPPRRLDRLAWHPRALARAAVLGDRAEAPAHAVARNTPAAGTRDAPPAFGMPLWRIDREYRLNGMPWLDASAEVIPSRSVAWRS